MHISSYQVQNILRVYNKQARLGALSTSDKKANTQLPMDEVSVSDEAKKRQILQQITSQVVDHVKARATQVEEEVTNIVKGKADNIDEQHTEKPNEGEGETPV